MKRKVIDPLLPDAVEVPGPPVRAVADAVYRTQQLIAGPEGPPGAGGNRWYLDHTWDGIEISKTFVPDGSHGGTGSVPDPTLADWQFFQVVTGVFLPVSGAQIFRSADGVIVSFDAAPDAGNYRILGKG